MSHEGVALVTRLVVVGLLILAGAIVRTFIGPSRRRGYIMGAGMLGGMSCGVLLNTLLSSWVHTDASVILAVAGMIVGWSVGWLFAKRIPRQAS
jgi:hypothetical protein